MAFKATLEDVVGAAHSVILGVFQSTYRTDIRHGQTVHILEQADDAELFFDPDQVVEVDDEGHCVFKAKDGLRYDLTLEMTRAITEEDVIRYGGEIVPR